MSVVMMEQKQGPESWNDDRLDDLNHKVDRGFERVDRGFAEVRTEFRALRSEMAADRRTLVQMGAAMCVTSVVGFLGVIATIVVKF
jgi:hypothetical protein